MLGVKDKGILGWGAREYWDGGQGNIVMRPHGGQGNIEMGTREFWDGGQGNIEGWGQRKVVVGGQENLGGRDKILLGASGEGRGRIKSQAVYMYMYLSTIFHSASSL